MSVSCKTKKYEWLASSWKLGTDLLSSKFNNQTSYNPRVRLQPLFSFLFSQWTSRNVTAVSGKRCRKLIDLCAGRMNSGSSTREFRVYLCFVFLSSTLFFFSFFLFLFWVWASLTTFKGLCVWHWHEAGAWGLMWGLFQEKVW